uniref:Peptidyl-prolyl cis-trans isomerase n=1 Tax=Panagrellus redivivus TaxID=6233 RepID=A0A7E4ZSR5_PANRE
MSSDSSKIRALHLLVKHNKSRRPSSWREQTITRSGEEAIEILKKHHAELAKIEDPQELKAKFKDLASVNSDCSSAKRGGDLGYFTPESMQPEFSQATLKLKPYELSDVVKTDSGYHLILRLA